MTIIALKGRSNIGKTTTIRLLHDLLLQNGYQLLSTTYTPLGVCLSNQAQRSRVCSHTMRTIFLRLPTRENCCKVLATIEL